MEGGERDGGIEGRQRRGEEGGKRDRAVKECVCVVYVIDLFYTCTHIHALHTCKSHAHLNKDTKFQ